VNVFVLSSKSKDRLEKTIENKTEMIKLIDIFFLTQDDRIFVVVLKSYFYNWIDGIVGKRRERETTNSTVVMEKCYT
jgi:hypothetical protein